MSSLQSITPITQPDGQAPLKLEPPVRAVVKLESPEAEKRAVGTLLADPSLLVTYRMNLPAEDEFTVTACRAAMRGLMSMIEKQSEFDYRAVALDIFHHDKRSRISLLKGYDDLSETEALQVIEHHFASLISHGGMDRDSLAANLAMVRDMATRRMMVAAARALEDSAHNKEFGTESIVHEFAGQLVDMQARSPKLQIGTAEEGMAAVEDRMNALDDGTERDVCVSTGIALLDQAIGGGMVPGVTTVAALTGNGKTTFAYHTILTACKQGLVVVLASTENDRDTVYRELLAIEAGVPSSAIRTGAFRRAEPAAFRRASATVASMRLSVFHYDDSTGMPFDVLETAIQIAKLKYGRVDLVVVDWLQDMQAPASVTNVREPEKLVQTKLNYIMPRMKQLGKSHGVAVLGTAQLTKASIMGGLDMEYIAGSQEIARRSEAVILVGLSGTHDKAEQDKHKFLIKVGKKRSEGAYMYFDDHFRLDPVTRRILTTMREPVHPAQFNTFAVVAPPQIPADLYGTSDLPSEDIEF